MRTESSTVAWYLGQRMNQDRIDILSRSWAQGNIHGLNRCLRPRAPHITPIISTDQEGSACTLHLPACHASPNTTAGVALYFKAVLQKHLKSQGLVPHGGDMNCASRPWEIGWLGTCASLTHLSPDSALKQHLGYIALGHRDRKWKCLPWNGIL